MLFNLIGVHHRHLPAAKINHARAELFVCRVEWSELHILLLKNYIRQISCGNDFICVDLPFHYIDQRRMKKSQEIVAVTVRAFFGKGARLERVFQEGLQPAHSAHIEGALSFWENPEKGIDRVARELAEIQQQFRNALIVIGGHSYGALPALLVALRARLENILMVVLVDGPIGKADVPMHPGLFMFVRHYLARMKLVEECERLLQEVDRTKIISFGNYEDTVVPPNAKMIPGEPPPVIIQMNAATDNVVLSPNGTHIVLPVAGHGLREKMPFIQKVVGDAVGVP